MTGRTARAIGVVTACLALAAATDSRPSFGVGVLRRDGLVIPFATYNGRRWESNWPVPKLDLVVPIDIRAVPKDWWGPTPALRTWDAWTGAAGPQPVEATGLDWVDVHCLRQIGLKTTYRSDKPVPAPTVQPYPKDGLVVSPPQAVEPIEMLPASAPEVRAIASDLKAAFNKAERQVELQFGHPLKPRDREGMAPEIEAVYAYGQEPRFYYIESMRAYNKLGVCDAVAFGASWFARERGTLRSLSTFTDLLGCDRYGASYMFPFGVLRLGGKLFWVAQFSGWDRERFVVIEIRRKMVEARLSVFGGGC